MLFEMAPCRHSASSSRSTSATSQIAAGQHGNILLSAFPNEPIRFQVDEDHAGLQRARGQEFLSRRSQARADDPRLRPGMEGVGKIGIERRRYIWIWTHQAVDSLRLLLWKWLPDALRRARAP